MESPNASTLRRQNLKSKRTMQKEELDEKIKDEDEMNSEVLSSENKGEDGES